MDTFAMVLVSIILIGIFVGFIFLVAKGAERLIKNMQETPDVIRNTQGMSVNELSTEIERGGKFVIFPFCIMAGVWESKTYFIRAGEWTAKYSIGYIIRTIIWIWLSPRAVISSIYTNLKGGKDVTQITLNAISNS
jgi:hypothetical protein